MIIRDPLIMMPLVMCMLNLWIQNTCQSASNSLQLSPQLFCMTLANVTSCGSIRVWWWISCNFPSWNIVHAVTYVSSFSAVSWHAMWLRQSVIITPVCLTYLTVYLYWYTLKSRCCNLGLNSARGLMLNCTRGWWSVWTSNDLPNLQWWKCSTPLTNA